MYKMNLVFKMRENECFWDYVCFFFEEDLGF